MNPEEAGIQSKRKPGIHRPTNPKNKQTEPQTILSGWGLEKRLFLHIKGKDDH